MATRYARYEPETKAKFLAAATEARNAGKTVSEAFDAAKEAGYKGTVGGLAQIVRDAGIKSKGEKKKAAKAPAPSMTAKPRGRPKNVVTVAEPAPTVEAVAVPEVSSVGAAFSIREEIRRIVREEVRAEIQAALKEAFK